MVSKDVRSPAALIPSLDKVLRSRVLVSVTKKYGLDLTTSILREIMEDLRSRILAGEEISKDVSMSAISEEASRRLKALTTPSLKTVLNLTGTVLHTNLGRAPLPIEALDAMVDVAKGASNLEYDLLTGGRGQRDDHLSDLICRLTGAEAACAVNNNAAAVLLILNTFAFGREVLVSRGELVEIGGAFRIPDIMSQAGAVLREVGTTNRTNEGDYESAINENTALIMKVHTSNFEIRGFTASVSEAKLAQIAHRHKLPVIVDLGSGSLVDFSADNIPKEVTVRESFQNSIDLICFSGDKLIGGPQAGFIAGSASMVKKINANPMKRAMRLDKIRIAGLMAVLQLYLNPETLPARLPALRLITRKYEDIKSMAHAIYPAISDSLNKLARVEVIDCNSQIGSGALPVDLLPSAGLSIKPLFEEKKNKTARSKALNQIAENFRKLPVPIIGKLNNGAIVLDLRCLENPNTLTDQLPELRRMFGVDL